MELSALLDAADFAAIRHGNQRRKDPEHTPYINHPLGVANILSKEGGVDELVVLQAALLHDTVEDTATSPEDLEAAFGANVRAVVMEVTDDRSLSQAQRKEAKVKAAPRMSNHAKLVVLADMLYNLRDLQRVTPEGWSDERVQKYFEWSSRVVQGLRGTNVELEKRLDELFAQHSCPASLPD
uniref:guanosine-3',5'-bis(diphosphate) 3'-pyrophosphohydrolase MESH1 n=1 Tax=Myxine glutinosa TaxID=7769 RepID=UPI00358F3931